MASAPSTQRFDEPFQHKADLAIGLDNFYDVWRHLKSQGWRSCNGPALSYDHYYIKHGKNLKNGVENEDFFLGERALVEFAKREKLFRQWEHSDSMPKSSSHVRPLHGIQSRPQGSHRRRSTSQNSSPASSVADSTLSFSSVASPCSSASVEVKRWSSSCSSSKSPVKPSGLASTASAGGIMYPSAQTTGPTLRRVLAATNSSFLSVTSPTRTTAASSFSAAISSRLKTHQQLLASSKKKRSVHQQESLMNKLKKHKTGGVMTTVPRPSSMSRAPAAVSTSSLSNNLRPNNKSEAVNSPVNGGLPRMNETNPQANGHTDSIGARPISIRDTIQANSDIQTDSQANGHASRAGRCMQTQKREPSSARTLPPAHTHNNPLVRYLLEHKYRVDPEEFFEHNYERTDSTNPEQFSVMFWLLAREHEESGVEIHFHAPKLRFPSSFGDEYELLLSSNHQGELCLWLQRISSFELCLCRFNDLSKISETKQQLNDIPEYAILEALLRTLQTLVVDQNETSHDTIHDVTDGGSSASDTKDSLLGAQGLANPLGSVELNYQTLKEDQRLVKMVRFCFPSWDFWRRQHHFELENVNIQLHLASLVEENRQLKEVLHRDHNATMSSMSIRVSTTLPGPVSTSSSMTTTVHSTTPTAAGPINVSSASTTSTDGARLSTMTSVDSNANGLIHLQSNSSIRSAGLKDPFWYCWQMRESMDEAYFSLKRNDTMVCVLQKGQYQVNSIVVHDPVTDLELAVVHGSSMGSLADYHNACREHPVQSFFVNKTKRVSRFDAILELQANETIAVGFCPKQPNATSSCFSSWLEHFDATRVTELRILYLDGEFYS